MSTHVDYGSGRIHDMARLTEKAHAAGALAIWDLAHSAGAITVGRLQADFAAGFTYKYLNGGPGSPAFIYLRPDHIDKARPALSGWLRHEAPFDFVLDYRQLSQSRARSRTFSGAVAGEGDPLASVEVGTPEWTTIGPSPTAPSFRTPKYFRLAGRGGFSRDPQSTSPHRHPLWSKKAEPFRPISAGSRASGSSRVRPWRLLARVRSRYVVAPCGGRRGARMGPRDAILHSRARSPDKRDYPRDRVRCQSSGEPRCHLSARMGCIDIALSAIVRRAVPISPLADLEPICLTAMSANLRLDSAEIVGESPARLSVRPGVEAHVWVGAQERPAFLWQARLLSEAWACPWTPESGKNHFDVVDGLMDPTSALMSACLRADRRST
jgi:hypothetical protein